ncbi:OsFBX59 - F-box domain containing protein expressed [Zea mays]|uniref:F-box protein n=1 Tax=Zea mays TaxID=4577 RepID=A0A1D6J6G1_MAIZE|nr:OsFBX59 - F-box domain containing protein expressed [Zea mays]
MFPFPPSLSSPLLSTRRPPLVLVSLFTSSSGSETPSSLSSFRVFSQSFSVSARIRAGELGKPRGDMDGLPRELCVKIFHLLDHQSLASSPQVYRKWRALTSDDELWRKLFNDRWGADAAAFYAPEGSKSWKDVFAVQDRCDRYGLGVRIIREGKDYYLIMVIF